MQHKLSSKHNAAITDAALGLLTGRTPEPRNHRGHVVSGYCLAQVRIIVEVALFGGARRFYEWRTLTASDKPTSITVPWARDMEASLRAAGMALDLPRTGPAADPARYVDSRAASELLEPGDLCWRWDTARHACGAYIGHVAVLVARDVVIENVKPEARAARIWSRGPTVLGPLTWPVTSVTRFDPDVPPA